MTLEENMGKEWYQILSPFIKSDTFQNLVKFLQREYKTKTIYPQRDDVFKAMRLTPFNKTRVIILEQDCYPNGEAIGLSFGINPSKHRIPPSLQMILTELESSYDKRLILDFDYTFESWAKQGVLMLNTALTVQKNKAGSHIELWKPFTAEVFKLLNTYHTGLIFVLLGNEAKKYKSMINSNQHIIEAPHPASECYKRGSGFLGSRIFNQIDELLTGMNGQNNLIQWNEYG